MASSSKVTYMAHKSKTQRAKASAARQQRKADRDNEVFAVKAEKAVEDEKPKKFNLLKKSDDEELKARKKAEQKAKKPRFQFLHEVRAELKRVTWPTKRDVLRWSGVVVVALLFFGISVAALDNLVVTPLLVFISGLGA